MLDALDLAICRKLETGALVAGDSEKAKTRLQSLVDRGYCKFGRARSGPLGLYTGETMVSLTAAGREALQQVTPNAEVTGA